jgi:hypothetical protein
MFGFLLAMRALDLKGVFLIVNYSDYLVWDLVTLSHFDFLSLITFVFRLMIAEHLLVSAEFRLVLLSLQIDYLRG